MIHKYSKNKTSKFTFEQKIYDPTGTILINTIYLDSDIINKTVSKTFSNPIANVAMPSGIINFIVEISGVIHTLSVDNQKELYILKQSALSDKYLTNSTYLIFV